MSIIIVIVYLWLQVKWNQFSSNNSHHTSCIHKGSHAGKWPDLMTSKPDSVSTLGYHWTDHTGRPLEPRVHWDATGTTLADASTQWCSSGDPVVICIIGTHWKTTGATSTLEFHWNHTGWTHPPDNKSLGCCCRNYRPTVINPDYNMTKQFVWNVFMAKYVQNLHQNRAPSPTCLHCDVTHLSLATWIVAFHIPSRRVRERSERRQARKTR